MCRGPKRDSVEADRGRESQPRECQVEETPTDEGSAGHDEVRDREEGHQKKGEGGSFRPASPDQAAGKNEYQDKKEARQEDPRVERTLQRQGSAADQGQRNRRRRRPEQGQEQTAGTVEGGIRPLRLRQGCDGIG